MFSKFLSLFLCAILLPVLITGTEIDEKYGDIYGLIKKLVIHKSEMKTAQGEHVILKTVDLMGNSDNYDKIASDLSDLLNKEYEPAWFVLLFNRTSQKTLQSGFSISHEKGTLLSFSLGTVQTVVFKFATQVMTKFPKEIELLLEARKYPVIATASKNIPAKLLDEMKTIIVSSVKAATDFKTLAVTSNKKIVKLNVRKWECWVRMAGIPVSSSENLLQENLTYVHSKVGRIAVVLYALPNPAVILQEAKVLAGAHTLDMAKVTFPEVVDPQKQYKDVDALVAPANTKY